MLEAHYLTLRSCRPFNRHSSTEHSSGRYSFRYLFLSNGCLWPVLPFNAHSTHPTVGAALHGLGLQTTTTGSEHSDRQRSTGFFVLSSSWQKRCRCQPIRLLTSQ